MLDLEVVDPLYPFSAIFFSLFFFNSYFFLQQLVLPRSTVPLPIIRPAVFESTKLILYILLVYTVTATYVTREEGNNKDRSMDLSSLKSRMKRSSYCEDTYEESLLHLPRAILTRFIPVIGSE